MPKPIDLLGQKFGDWEVLSAADSPPGYTHLRFWNCRCKCGALAVRKGAQLRWAQAKGMHQSCSQCARTRHGLTKSPEYQVWTHIHHRCENPASQAYKNYGARGVTVCERWATFEAFIFDMGPRPSPGHSLDRIDNAKGYSPENCRWVVSKVQNRNRRGNAHVTFEGKTLPISEWAEIGGFTDAVFRQRLIAGWSMEEALNIPVGQRRLGSTRGKAPSLMTARGKTQTRRQWADELGIPLATLHTRLYNGRSLEEMLP